MNPICNVTDTPIDVMEVISSVRSPLFGAIVPFIGTVREWTGERHTQWLHYESYPDMAVSEMRKIIEEIENQFQPIAVSAVHRIGTLQVGDIALVVAVAAPHRKTAFEACRFMIERLKQVVPIWKKEVWDGGEEWLGPSNVSSV